MRFRAGKISDIVQLQIWKVEWMHGINLWQTDYIDSSKVKYSIAKSKTTPESDIAAEIDDKWKILYSY